ncbi:unnamed protein product [Strongylus vulgaris]|uniref:Uncharacterized protein n=1 Tax=Strongylus vulgaris TaxID=40348 RepID=A0A3P7IH25_STRVU|nr:unnamed protein product [Strongylus vulgaris]
MKLIAHHIPGHPVNGKGPPPVEQLKKLQLKFAPADASAPPVHPRLAQMSAGDLLSPGKLVSPMPQGSSRPTPSPHNVRTPLQPEGTDVGGMNHYTTKPTVSLSLPLEVYCAPSTTYIPYRVTSPNDTSGKKLPTS